MSEGSATPVVVRDPHIYDALENLYENLAYYTIYGGRFKVYGGRQNAEFLPEDTEVTERNGLRCFVQSNTPFLYIDRELADGNIHEEAWLAHPDAGDTVRKVVVPRAAAPEDAMVFQEGQQ